MKSNELMFLKLKDNQIIANSFYNAILYLYPNLKYLAVNYDGINLTFDFVGSNEERLIVLASVNSLIEKTTEKKGTKIDLSIIIENTVCLMKKNFGDDYATKLKPVKYVNIMESLNKNQ